MAETNNAADVLRTGALVVRRPAAQLTLAVPPLRIAGGDAIALLGPSGAGKTTLLEGLLGLLQPPAVQVAGERWFSGQSMPAAGSDAWRRWLRRDVAFLPQDARAALDPTLRLGVQAGELSAATPGQCAEWLRALGEPDADAVLGRFPHQVSGGQAQRVLLAIALARAPALLVADEPTASLDGARQALLVAALRRLRDRGGAVLVATHDADLARALAARPFTLADGEVRAGAPPQPVWPGRGQLPADKLVLLRASGLQVRRGHNLVLRGIDLELHSGEVVAVLGPSGAGKTSLLVTLAGLLRPSAGRVEQLGARPAQLLFQDAYASLTPHLALRVLARETASSDDAVDELARALGLGDAELQRPARALSGGQRRRAALLRALTVSPRVLLLDEPTASLDAATAASVMAGVLAAAASRDAACLLVTHDRSLAQALAHRVFTLEDGLLVATR